MIKRVCVIPDIHHKIKLAQKIVEENENKVDLFVALGDYLDDFNDKPGDTKKTMRWVREFVNRGDTKALAGNHDMAYMHGKAKCSGWTQYKQYEYDAWMRDHADFNTDSMLAYYMIGDVVFTHAGIAEGVNLYDCEYAYNNMRWTGAFDTKYLGAHVLDGGYCNPAGIFWNRPQYNELSRDYGFQVFGHTTVKRPVLRDDFLMLDTNLNHYAIIEFDENGKKKGIDICAI